jgi:hypothetical protein
MIARGPSIRSVAAGLYPSVRPKRFLEKLEGLLGICLAVFLNNHNKRSICPEGFDTEAFRVQIKNGDSITRVLVEIFR